MVEQNWLNERSKIITGLKKVSQSRSGVSIVVCNNHLWKIMGMYLLFFYRLASSCKLTVTGCLLLVNFLEVNLLLLILCHYLIIKRVIDTCIWHTSGTYFAYVYKLLVPLSSNELFAIYRLNKNWVSLNCQVPRRDAYRIWNFLVKMHECYITMSSTLKSKKLNKPQDLLSLSSLYIFSFFFRNVSKWSECACRDLICNSTSGAGKKRQAENKR